MIALAARTHLQREHACDSHLAVICCVPVTTLTEWRGGSALFGFPGCIERVAPAEGVRSAGGRRTRRGVPTSESYKLASAQKAAG